MNNHFIQLLFTLIFLTLFGLLVACDSTTTQPSIVNPSVTCTPFPTATNSPTLSPINPDEKLVSPNGQFIGRTFHYQTLDHYHEALEIVDVTGTPIASFSHMQPPVPDPHAYLMMASWSPNSLSLYYYYAWGFDGFITLWDGFDLQSINSKEGYITPLVNGLMSFSFSPNGSYLAYSRDDDKPRQLTIHNLETSVERHLIIELPEHENTQVGWIIWAPTEDGLIFHTSTGLSYSIYYLTLASMETVHLLDCAMEINWCEFDQWLDNETIRINKVESILEIKVKSGMVTSTATLTPLP